MKRARLERHRGLLVLCTALPLGVLACASDTEPLAPDHIQVVRGGDQIGHAGAPLADSIVVQVQDGGGRPVPHAEVTWRVLQGGGSVSAAVTSSDSVGIVRSVWTLGLDAGTHLLSAAAGGTTVTIRATGRIGIR